jgi:hypothetical protein
MGQRSVLNQVLSGLCENVYFQPPSNVQMQYPAIVYERDAADTMHADNVAYRFTKKYELKLISRNPDESIFEALAAMPMCRHERFFVADNLNHDVFTLYF